MNLVRNDIADWKGSPVNSDDGRTCPGGAHRQDVLSVEDFLATGGPRCAVLGRPVAHSQSPTIHRAGYRALGLDAFSYHRIEAGELAELQRLVRDADGDVRGFSVTMPGKSAALAVADEATGRATRIGAANTLVHRSDGSWLADNTDVDGVRSCLRHLRDQGSPELSGASVVVVGNGGTARPAVAALAAAGARELTVLARSERALQLRNLAEGLDMSFQWIPLHDDRVADACANAAAVVSTIPSAAAADIAPMAARAGGVVDVIYGSGRTPLVTEAAAQSTPWADGLRMLAGQAERQFELFTGLPAPTGLFQRVLLGDG